MLAHINGCWKVQKILKVAAQQAYDATRLATFFTFF